MKVIKKISETLTLEIINDKEYSITFRKSEGSDEAGIITGADFDSAFDKLKTAYTLFKAWKKYKYGK